MPQSRSMRNGTLHRHPAPPRLRSTRHGDEPPVATHARPSLCAYGYAISKPAAYQARTAPPRPAGVPARTRSRLQQRQRCYVGSGASEDTTLSPDIVKARLMKTAAKSFPISSVALSTGGRLLYHYDDLFTGAAGYHDVWAALTSTDVVPPKLSALSSVAKADSPGQ